MTSWPHFDGVSIFNTHTSVDSGMGKIGLVFLRPPTAGPGGVRGPAPTKHTNRFYPPSSWAINTRGLTTPISNCRSLAGAEDVALEGRSGHLAPKTVTGVFPTVV